MRYIRCPFLIDDFNGSGKTLLRQEGDTWKGKLKKLAQSYSDHRQIFSADCAVAVHHYISTQKPTRICRGF